MEDKGLASINTFDFSYTWKIGYDELQRKTTGNALRRDFSVIDFTGFEWRLTIYPKGHANQNKNYTALYIYLMSSKQYPVVANISFHILSSQGVKCNKHGLSYWFSKEKEGTGSPQFILFNDLLNKNFIINNILTIVCDIFIQAPIKNKDLSVCELSLDNFSQDFQRITKNPDFSDVTLKVRGQKFTAHKVILSARSPVFAALLNADMKEKNQNEITIDDVELDVFKEMLRFIYTGKVKNLDELAYELFSLSDKYALKHLRSVCGSVLYKNLSVDNAIDILTLFDRHSATELKNKVFSFISSNITSIVNLDSFKTLEKTNPSLAIEVFRFAVTK